MQINYELCSYIFAAIGGVFCVWNVILYNKNHKLKKEVESNKFLADGFYDEMQFFRQKLTTANANKASLTNQVNSLKKKLVK
jgi:hypothetical protein